jgi:signal transduction histidine kinase
MRILLKNLDTGRAPEIALGVQNAVHRMAGMVENIMDFARGRLGGGLTIKRDAKLPLTPVLEQIIAEFRTAWPNVRINSSIQIAEPLNCDRGKMGQLFSNLLGNAVAYGDQGRPIRVAAKTSDGTFDLTVSNEGPPISEKALANLFKPYTRGDRPSQNGLGLGLYIASQIAQAHGGKLSAVSTASETTFSFEMPV